jgi:plasmid maintenance system killer protein
MRASSTGDVIRLTYCADGQHTIRISDRWRICFRWKDSDAYDVEINHHYI